MVEFLNAKFLKKKTRLVLNFENDNRLVVVVIVVVIVDVVSVFCRRNFK